MPVIIKKNVINKSNIVTQTVKTSRLNSTAKSVPIKANGNSKSVNTCKNC